MKKLVLIFAILCSVASIVLSSVAVARGGTGYDIAVRNGFIGTEQEWLDSLIGKDGKDGENGKDGEDGKDGKDGEKGEKGETGDRGADGAVWMSGHGAPVDDSGKTGDYYLDFEDGSVYEKTETGWVWRGFLDIGEFIVEQNKISVLFDADDGTAPVWRKINKGERISDMPVPVRRGYVFRGWYFGDGVNAGQANELTVFNEDTTLKAKWEFTGYYLDVTADDPGSIPVNDKVFHFTANYSGTAAAEISLWLEKDGEKRSVSDADGWVSAVNFQSTETENGVRVTGSLIFATPGEYVLTVSAAEDGKTTEGNIKITVI